MRFIGGRFLIGLLILGVGIIMLLNNLVDGIEIDFSIGLILSYWPVIPLVLGLNWLIASFSSTGVEEGRKVFFPWGQFFTAMIAIVVGVAFLGRNLGYFDFNISLAFNLFWPIILILIGINLLRGRAHSGGRGGRFTFMSGSKVSDSQPWKLESGSYFALMGGIEMDLTNAEITTGETVLDLTAIMGGIEVKLPKDSSVIYEGSAIMGGTSFKDKEDGGLISGRKIEQNIDEHTSSFIRIQARAVMGGIEITEAKN